MSGVRTSPLIRKRCQRGFVEWLSLGSDAFEWRWHVMVGATGRKKA
jgi:hypothetical protein